ncbi:MAG TPA: hypothetical protein VFF47_08655 [Nitrospirota bacterium]|nr:hypothetical protein [Nitrospirota bacterium]
MSKKNLLAVGTLSVLFIIIGVYAYQYSGSVKIKTSESPEEVVKKFYSYIAEGGSSSLSEAYRQVSSKRFTLTEDKFKGIVLNYPKNMVVKIIGSKVVKDRAVVKIEYKCTSAFGGEVCVTTDINLDLDEKSRSWKIDFTGESNPDGKNS